jgi:DNA-binding PadR family transcriptional regulator
MANARVLSSQAAAILGALSIDAETWRYGYELCKQLGIQSGSLYPILTRLADRHLLETRWESDAPSGRPARHLYRLSPAMRVAAAELA